MHINLFNKQNNKRDDSLYLDQRLPQQSRQTKSTEATSIVLQS